MPFTTPRIIFSIIVGGLLIFSILILFLKTNSQTRPLLVTTPLFVAVFCGFCYTMEYTHIFALSRPQVLWCGAGYQIQVVLYLPALIISLPVAAVFDALAIKNSFVGMVVSGLWVALVYSWLPYRLQQLKQPITKDYAVTIGTIIAITIIYLLLS